MAKKIKNTNVNLNNLSLDFNNKPIISNLNLEIIDSEIHSMVGLSGAGKSQLLRTIVNLNSNYTKVNINKKIGIVFQENNLIPWLTLKENIEIINPSVELNIDELFEQVNLKGYQNYKPHQVSGGMQQRVALVRALASNCNFLLLDEPFSKLDYINKNINYEVLLKLWKSKNMTILMVTHDLDEAIYLSSRVSFFSKTKKHITHTENVSFTYPRNFTDLKRSEKYFSTYTKLTELFTEDFKHDSN